MPATYYIRVGLQWKVGHHITLQLSYKFKYSSNTVARLSRKVCIFAAALHWTKCTARNGVGHHGLGFI